MLTNDRRTRRIALVIAGLLSLPAVALGAPPARAIEGDPELTLEAALAAAFENSPAIAAAAAEVAAARGRLVTARTYPFNPELAVGAARREGPDESTTDREAALSQEVEIAGQRGKRVATAEAELAAVEAGYRWRRQLVAAAVAHAFADAVAARDLAGLAGIEADLARELLRITARRFEAGAATQVDLNLARASSARAERRLELARSVEAEARSLLAEAAGRDPTSPPVAAGSLALPAGEPASLAELVAGALARRADLDAFRRAREAAAARLRLARAEAVPNLELGVFHEREEGTDDLYGGGVAIALPLFNRNRGGIAEARADAERAGAETALLELAVRREVYAALARYRASRTSAERLGEQVVGGLSDSLELLERSFAAGKIGLAELLVFRGELVASRQEHIEATADAWQARIDLDLAAGRLPLPGEDDSRQPETDPETDR